MRNCEFEAKAKFVCLKLLPTISAATRGSVVKAVYESCGDDETVVIEYSHGGLQRIDVTGDSLLSLTKNVLEAVS